MAETMRVPVKTEYRLGEQTEQRLREMGARCVMETSDVEYYYDTSSFQLASTQTWLFQHNGQWGLMLAEEQETNHPQSDDNQMSKSTTSSPEERSETSAPKEMSKTSSDTSLRYTELRDTSTIMSHLSKCLQLPLTLNEMQNMTMKSFLNMAQIQMFDSWTRTSTMRYSLPGGFSLVVERNYRIPTETPSAFLMMNAEVLSISSELEKMDRLRKSLSLYTKANSDE
ncbi:uncharacterized protein isoform X1 [Danio rerio]|uniref:Si:dkey-191c17.2 n=2 Tax=Danio rerio TaxID=7955 RepID=B0V1A2_DANRE|nr:uncharacterized protein LOC100005628 [Danio rerio]|eukprot:NP_001116797.1 uncharacterized protein LOC100005628 [Danio rerio]